MGCLLIRDCLAESCHKEERGAGEERSDFRTGAGWWRIMMVVAGLSPGGSTSHLARFQPVSWFVRLCPDLPSPPPARCRLRIVRPSRALSSFDKRPDPPGTGLRVGDDCMLYSRPRIRLGPLPLSPFAFALFPSFPFAVTSSTCFLCFPHYFRILALPSLPSFFSSKVRRGRSCSGSAGLVTRSGCWLIAIVN